MPPTKKSNRAIPKVFRCSGYGDCQTVFTRSEHLARHVRMHTGEKPFECIVTGCNRKFSRCDNMVQHTRTHERQRKKSSGPSTVCAVSSTPVAESTTFTTSPASPQRTHGNGNKYIMKIEALLSPPESVRVQPQRHAKRASQSPEEARKRHRTLSADEEPGKPRRLSLLDLESPLDCWTERSASEDSGASTPIAEVTSDEYEAILAFGRFVTDAHHTHAL